MTHAPPRPLLTPAEIDAIADGRKWSGRAYLGARAVLIDGTSVRAAAQAQGVSNTSVQRVVDEILKRHAERIAAT